MLKYIACLLICLTSCTGKMYRGNHAACSNAYQIGDNAFQESVGAALKV